jgi:predicted AlkP superfamily phosphohydrolase/phosphomutase
MGYIDPSSSRYGEVGEDEREKLWEEVKDMYVELDDIVGEALKHADKDTLFVLSSDHGAAPLDVWVRLNNFFAEKGWLVYSFDEKSGEPTIDYEQSTVVYLKMDSVYINPEGLGPTWVRGEGEKYEQLRREVREVLEGLEYDGQKVVSGVFDWEDVGEFLDLPSDRVGDLVVANSAGFGWNEELTTDERVFDVPLKTGYKQAIFAEQTEAMWTPFVIAGPGIRKGFKLSQPIQHVDQLPTILTVMEVQVPDYVEGQTLNEILV